MPQIPEGVGGVASSRRGLLIRPVLLASDISDDRLSTDVSHKLVRRLQQGVAIATTIEPTWTDHLRAAVFATPGAMASHTSAARLHGLDGIRTAMLEITIPYNGGGEPRGGVITHRTRRFKVATVVDDIPVTSVEQTLLDLAGARRRVPTGDLLKAVASALRKRLTTMAMMRAFLVEASGKGVPGLLRLRQALDRYDDGSPPPGSDGEVAMFEFLRANGIELPTRQFELKLPSGLTIYLDFAWGLRTKSIEFDGLASRADAEAHDAELERQNEIWDLGWELRRFSPVALRKRPRETYRKIVRFLEAPPPTIL